MVLAWAVVLCRPDDLQRRYSCPPRVSDLQKLTFIMLLGFDVILAILELDFVPTRVAYDWVDSGEQVLGVSINGDHRAYYVPMLSRHDIVDVVGGVPIAITW